MVVRNRCWLAALLLVALANLCLAQTRTWTDRSGKFRIEAELVETGDGAVRLRKASGDVVSVPLENLSDADREFLRGGATAKPGDTQPATEDEIELLSGSRLKGRITARTADSITIEVTLGARVYSRNCPVARIHAVTTGGRREVLNAKPGGDDPAASDNGPSDATGTRRSRAEIDALIDKMGRTPPDWWDSVPLNYPKTLDLTWPARPSGNWNNQRNVGQYLWDVINPNPGKWREGIRFVHHLLQIHENDPDTRARAMETLGRMYCNLEQDYPRAAFWWRQAGVGSDRQSPSGVKLAECYWKLGNKAMAVELLGKLPVYASAIKLWADMGETAKALQFAESLARSGWPDLAYLYAGDACRIQGQYAQAIQYYEKVLAVPATGQGKKRIDRCHQRAQSNIAAIRIYDALDLRRIPDGTYEGTSEGYAGPLHVKVVVQGGRIESVEVTSHKEKQFYSAVTDTPRQIVEKQGVKGVDAVTGATITSEAIVNAAAQALSSANKQ